MKRINKIIVDPVVLMVLACQLDFDYILRRETVLSQNTNIYRCTAWMYSAVLTVKMWPNARAKAYVAAWTVVQICFGFGMTD